ncbi:MAG: acyltransferase family protein [Lachnospiraceae bacterium]
MSLKTDQRDYLFDNYKAFLILLIVIGHFIEESYTDNIFLDYLKWGIYVFHVPAFVFVSGYFSKKEYPVHQLIGKLLIPYLVYEVIYYFYYTYILKVETGLHLLYPKFSLWYLLCLFTWRLMASKIKKSIPCFVIAVIAGLLIGISQMKDNFLSIPRMLVFFPFYIAGKWVTREEVMVLRSQKYRRICGLILVVLFGLLFLFAHFTELSPKVFYGRYNYQYLEQGLLEGMLFRLAAYLIGFAITLAFIGVITDRKMKFSYIGSRTLAIYVIHGYIYNFFKKRTGLIDDISTPAETIILLAFCIGLTLLLSLPVFTRMTAFVSNMYTKLLSVVTERRKE